MAFGWVGFRVDRLAETAAPVAPAEAWCKANTGCSWGLQGKDEGDAHLEPVAHRYQLIRCSVKLNSTANPKKTWPEVELRHTTSVPPELQTHYSCSIASLNFSGG